jgi:glycosyltransferase involved in cell wall biosynthesis
LYYWWYRLKHRVKFDVVQVVESNVLLGNLCYAHFCHRAFLKYHWESSKRSGWRSWGRWLDHRLHSLMEPIVFRKARRIVVPSQGLARELKAEYPFVDEKLLVLPNPVDLERMKRPAEFDREAFRTQHAFEPGDLVLVFVALGHFERKGLPLLLDALRQVGNPRLKLMIVGGTNDLLDTYRRRVDQMGLTNQVRFAGMQRDVRPYMWAADAFVLPSHYETFSLVAFEAAAAGLPVIVSPLHGVEEFVVDGENGYIVEPQVAALRAGLTHFTAEAPERRAAVGLRAQRSMPPFSVQAFANRWRQCYAR